MDTSSSDGGFAWTDASGSSGSGTEIMMTVEHEDGAESESGSSYKMRLQKQLFQSEDNTNQQCKKATKKAKKRKFKEEPLEENEEIPRAKFVKSEPESDIDLPKKKKKRKHDSQFNRNLHDSSGAKSEESYLDMKVKEEQSKFSLLNPVEPNKETTSDELDNISKTDHEFSFSDDYSKHDKLSKVKDNKRNKIRKETNEMNDESNIRPNQESQDADRKKVKKKKSKKDKENPANCDSMILIDKFSSDEGTLETFVETKTCGRSNKSRKKSGLNDSINSFNIPSVKEQNVNTIKNLSNNVLQTTGDGTSEHSIDDDNNPLRDVDEHDTPKQSKNECPSHIEESGQRIARISDRIRFEDEENSELETAHERKIKLLQVEKFRKAKSLKPISFKLPKQATITQNDELWILKCPQDIDANALMGVSLTIDNRCKIKVGGVTYEGSLDNETKSATLLTSDCGAAVIKRVAVNGVVNLRRRVPKPHFVEDKVIVNNQTDFIPLPETKCRHPLFGSDYRRAIKLSKSVRERLSGVLNRSDETGPPIKVNRKKKKRKLSEDERDETGRTTVEPRIKIEPQAAGLEVCQEKRKRKHSSSERVFTKKRRKQDHSSAEVWDSEKAIEENLFNY